MGRTPEEPNAAEALRLRAERIATAIASKSKAEIEALAPDGLGLLLHELLVHKLELEMQNEELRQTQTKLEIQRARYFGLYDLAPVGYCSVGERGLIQEANLTASTLLGIPRSKLVAQPFTRFILKEDQDVYYRFRKSLLEAGRPQPCELRMARGDGAEFWGSLTAAVAQDEAGLQVCHLAISDVSDRKRAEENLRQSLEEKAALLRDLQQRS